MTEIDIADLREKAEAQRAAWERMVQIGGGIGALGVTDPDMFRDVRRWSALTENDHADVVLALLDRLAAAGRLIRDFTDPDPCWFDHHGGCQSHGYLSLQPGELCPHAEAKRDWSTL